MSKRQQRYFWHVQANAWYGGTTIAGAGIPNTGLDIAVPLVTSQGDLGTLPEHEEWVVERIVGQYQVSATEAVASPRHLHHRVYVCDSDAGAVSLRNLNTADEAETEFLWHQVDGWVSTSNALVHGYWQLATNHTPPHRQGRFGHVDVRVGRRISQGRDLVWHTMITGGAAAPADNTFWLKLWLRCLIREG